MSGLAFTAPWLLLAAAALTVPYLAHLARSDEREGRPFPSLMFLRRVPIPSRARRRLQDRALLALRALALLALVLAFAGPHWPRDAAAPADRGADTVVLLDVSYSMAADAVFAAARAIARQALHESAPAGRVALVAFDDEARIISGFDSGREGALAALARLEPGYRGTDFAAALRRAGQMLDGAGAAPGRVVLVSDLQRAGLREAPVLGAGHALDVRRVAAAVGSNLSLSGAWLRIRERGEGHVLNVRVDNTGAAPMQAELRVTVNDLEAAREAAPLRPGESREFEFPVFATPGAVSRVRVSLADDALAADNDRFLVLAPPRAVSALLVSDGTAAAYVEAALALSSQPPVQLRLIAPAALDAAALGDVDVLILDAVTGRDAAVRDALARRAVAGMGLLVFASAAGGESVFLPGVLGDALASPPQGLSIWPTAPAHTAAPALGPPGSAVGPVWRRVALQPAGEDTVLASFDDGTPALLSRSVGRGRSVLLATVPADGWSELGRRPEFAPWLLRSVAWLTGTRAGAVIAAHAPGDVIDVGRLAARSARQAAGGEGLADTSAAGEALRVQRPDGTTRTLGERAVLPLDRPGFYRFRAGSAPALPLAVNVSAREAHRDSFDAAAFTAELRRVAVADAAPPRAQPAMPADQRWALWLALLGALLLVVEGIVAARMARARHPAAAREVPA